MRTTPTGLADLARAFNALNPTRSECLAIARLLGLDGDIAFEPRVQANPVSSAAVVALPLTASELPIAAAPLRVETPMQTFRRMSSTPVHRGPHRFDGRAALPRADTVGLPIRLTELKAPATGAMPSYVADAMELDFEIGALRHVPTPEPLVPHDQLRALIRDLIAAPVPGEPDIPRLVDALARGHLPRVLPRQERKGTANSIHILVDTADSMRLFHRDASDLLEALRKVALPAIRSMCVTYGAPSASVITEAARGDTLLILSDLGIGSRSAIKHSRVGGWRDFGVRQRSRGLNLTAVVPFHYDRWPAELKRRMRLIHWHRPGSVSVPVTDAQLRRLATALSASAVIDPALLRRGRMNVLPLADAGAESDLAMGRWTAAYNPRVIAFVPSWTRQLRTELAADPELLTIAERLLQRPHTRDWDRVVFEEKIIRWSLRSDQENPELVKAALASVIRSLLGRMHDADSARWALCFLEELPESVQQSEAAQLLRATASIVLHAPDDQVSKIVAEYDASWIFGRKVEIGILWTGEFLVAREPPLVSDRLIAVPATWPRVVIVDDLDGTRPKVLRIFRNDPLPAWTGGDLPRLIKTVDGGEYHIEGGAALWQTLVSAFREGQSLTGVLTRFLHQRESYVVDIGFNALLRADQLPAFDDPAQPLGSEVAVKIDSIDNKSREIRVSLAKPFPPGVADAEDASAPEVSEELWAQLLARYRACDLVTGTLLAVKEGTRWTVDVLGAKASVSKADLTLDDINSSDELIGLEMEFFILDVNKQDRRVTLSRRLADVERLKELFFSLRADRCVKGTVTRRVKGGMTVDLSGIRAFLPTSQVDIKPVKNLDALVGKQFDFKVISLDMKRNNVVVTRLSIVKAERDQQKRETLSKLKVGELARGTVKTITDYGVFVNLNGVDGLMHITDISWGRVNHPSERFKINDEIEVVVLKFDPADERIGLGYKQKWPDPWSNISARYRVGVIVRGRVISLTDYGAFVELEEGIEGLIHVSEMSWTKKVRKPSKMYSIGDEVDAVVTAVNGDTRRIGLSTKMLQPNPWETLAERYPVGAVISGKVRNLTEFGAFVELEDGIDGMIHISDLSENRRIKHPNQLLKKGDAVQARVISVDRNTQRLGLSIKEFLLDEFVNFAKTHSVGDEIVGTVGKITDFGLFVRVADGVEGLAHISEIPDVPKKHLSDHFQTGDAIRARIIKIDPNEKKIGLTLRDVAPLT